MLQKPWVSIDLPCTKKSSDMIYKRFYFRIILQLLLFTITVFLLSWALQHPNLLVFIVNLSIIGAIQIIYLIWYINKVNRDLARFFEAFRFNDATITFDHNQKKHKKFDALYHEFDRLIKEFRKLRNEQEKDRFFYLNALNHVGIGLMVINESGLIRFSNQALLKLAGTAKIFRIEDLNKLKPGFAELLIKMDPKRREL